MGTWAGHSRPVCGIQAVRLQPIMRADLDEKKFKIIVASLDPQVSELLDLVSDSYFGLTACELERLTHNEDPWRITRSGLAEDKPSDRVIDKALTKKYYRGFIQDGA